MQMIDLMKRLAELDAGNPNIIYEGQGSPVLQQLLAMQQKYRGTPYEQQLNKRVADQQWREANGKGTPVDAAGRPVPVLSPEEFEKKNPNYLKPSAASGKPDMMKPMADAGEQAPLSESMDLAECGMMPMPGMGGQPHTPASISMTASSGPELSGMLADIMKLAGVHQVEPAHMGIEPEHDHSDIEVISAEPTPLDSSDKTEIMRSMMDRMNGEMDDEEEADEGMYDNSPEDPEPPAPFDANEFAHRENQPGQGDRMDGDKPKGFPTMEEQLMADWKQFMTEGVAEGSDKEALHQELLKINQQMKLNHPRYNDPNSPGHTDRYFELMKKKDAIIAQLKKGVAEGLETKFKVGDKVRIKNKTQPAQYMTITDIKSTMSGTKIKLDLAPGWWTPESLVHYTEKSDKEALHQELLKINQQMKLTHPRYNDPNSGHTNRYFELMKKKDAIIAQLQQDVSEGEDWTGSSYDPDWLPKGKKKPKLSDIKVKFPPKKQEPKQQGVEPKQQGVADD